MPSALVSADHTSVVLAMDASPLFDPQYLPVILTTLLGFGALALLLLVPIARFLNREQEVSKHWTPEELAKRLDDEERRREMEAALDESPHDESPHDESPHDESPLDASAETSATNETGAAPDDDPRSNPRSSNASSTG
jgi:hypothetical protein